MFVGVDVGTGSARAGVFDGQGALLGRGAQNITLFHGPGAMVEQSSSEIWEAVSSAARAAMAEAGAAAADIQGLGFDATCSLVVLDAQGASLPVGPSEDAARDIIVWMDHRAVDQAERINATEHPVLAHVGGRISPEMQTPKLLWLKENRPKIFDKAAHFFDLPDYLGWRATGSLARSVCTLVCKWTYLAHEARWDPSYFDAIGLGVLAHDGFARIGTKVVPPGTPLARGLTAQAAQDLGLLPGIPVGAGLIDAHAGGVGTVGADGDPGRSMAYVFGTSSCTMTTVADPIFVPGIWGPYFEAMVPGHWLLEGGQSAAGAAIDQLLALHPAKAEAEAKAGTQALPDWLAAQALEAAGSASDTVALAQGMHVVPEFLGNRAPFADPHARALIGGLGMETGVDNLVALYIAGLCGIGYGLRQIIEAQTEHGASVAQIVISGGAGRSHLVRQILADASGLPVVVPATDEPVLLGAAMLGAVASGARDNLTQAMTDLSQTGSRYVPDPMMTDRHIARYRSFCALQALGQDNRFRGA